MPTDTILTLHTYIHNGINFKTKKSQYHQNVKPTKTLKPNTTIIFIRLQNTIKFNAVTQNT